MLKIVKQEKIIKEGKTSKRIRLHVLYKGVLYTKMKKLVQHEDFNLCHSSYGNRIKRYREVHGDLNITDDALYRILTDDIKTRFRNGQKARKPVKPTKFVVHNRDIGDKKLRDAYNNFLYWS